MASVSASSVAVYTKELPEIPMEIIVNILSLLPAKSLMRFCCVSKLWCALIGSRDFIKMHLNQAQESLRFHKLAFLGSSGTILSTDVDSLDQAHPLSLSPPCFPSEFSGACNGLILLVDEKNSLVIWNPFTRNYKNLPPENPTLFCKAKITNTKYGFGYDFVNDDYKVLSAVSWESIGDETLCFGEAKVYSLKSNTWKKTFHSPVPIPDSGRWAAYVNGAFHTLVPNQYIIGFDLATEESHPVPLPKDLQVDDVFKLTLVSLQGYLCIHCKKKSKKHTIDIWIMKEYNVIESWTILLSLAPPLIPTNAIVFPISFSISGQKVLLNMNNEFVWFDLKRDAFNEVGVKGSQNPFLKRKRKGKRKAGVQSLYVFHAEFCVETIVSPGRYGEGVIES